jgi:hypothetical protein
MSLNHVVRPYVRRFRGLMAGRGFRDVSPTIREEAICGRGDMYSAEPVNPALLRFPESAPGPHHQLCSTICRTEQLESPPLRYWLQRLGETFAYHRKAWEYALICQALYERDLLCEGKRGLGFAVGCEPLPALFAHFGCQVTASDLAQDDKRSQKWSRSNQWAGELSRLARPAICDDGLFQQRVSYLPVDMNDIPDDLTGYDFTWSSCSFEHCGSIQLGARFLQQQMKCLQVGGWAVHTTEFNLTSNHKTRETGTTVVFRRQDIEAMCRQLRNDGHYVEPLDLTVGTQPLDHYVDDKPYSPARHLRLRIGDWAATSIALIIRKGR